jgi:anthranilate phosphoribosyltransferase
MGDFANSAQIRSEEQAEVAEIVEAMRKQRQDPLTHTVKGIQILKICLLKKMLKKKLNLCMCLRRNQS